MPSSHLSSIQRVMHSMSLIFALLAMAVHMHWADAAKSYSQIKNARHPLTNMPGRASGIEVAYYLPEHADKKMPMNKQILVLCHIKNSAKIPFNLTGIMGSLNSINEFNGFAGYAQNFTYKNLGFMLKPGEEATLSYDFKLSKDHEPEKFQMAHTVFYESEKRGYSSTFFNETVTLQFGTDTELDLEALLQIALLVLGTAVTGFIIYIALCPESAFVVNMKKSIFGAETETAPAAAPEGNKKSGAGSSANSGSGAKQAPAGSKPEKAAHADDDEWIKLDKPNAGTGSSNKAGSKKNKKR